MLLDELIEDVLILIFSYLNEQDLKSVELTSVRCSEIIEKNFYERKCINLLMTSHVKNFELFRRTNGALKYSDRLEINKNWTYGTFASTTFCQHRESYVPLMALDSSYFYTTQLGELKVFRRETKNGLKDEPYLVNGNKNDSVITDLMKKDETLAGCRENGSVFLYTEDDGFSEEFVFPNKSKINSLDFHGTNFFVSTKNQSKLLNLTSELGILTFDTSKDLDDGYDNIRFDPTGTKILTIQDDNFYLIDSNTCQRTRHNFGKFQIFNTLWIDESCFLYTSYCNALTLIDCRMQFNKQEFSSGNFTATSIDFDGR
ncbi:unnamed protein product [Diamesa serratosioi]